MKKKALYILFIAISIKSFSCGGYEWFDGMEFYNLFDQKNISDKSYYPFLRIDDQNFYGNDDKKHSINENTKLWKEVLTNWTVKEIDEVIYDDISTAWDKKNSKIEKQAKKYIEFAQLCSSTFDYRSNYNSWDYEDLQHLPNSQIQSLLEKANSLLSEEQNEQLKMRYHYQIVRIFHYSQNWEDAVKYYENKIEDKFQKNEIYYYAMDQAAGCYYSLEQYEKAAYMFTKVVNHSKDRKKSAYLSYNWCANKDAEGREFFNGIEDEKNLLVMKSIRSYSDNYKILNDFITLDANDARIELVFMRTLNSIEREIWPKQIFKMDDINLPNTKPDFKGIDKLLKIADLQIQNNLENKDFWEISSSYLSFMNEDIALAKKKLAKIKSYNKQKKILSALYEVFSWKTITTENEMYLLNLKGEFSKKELEAWEESFDDDWLYIILDKVGNTYYKNNQLAKAFLVHNKVGTINDLVSLELIDALIEFKNKENKNDYELDFEKDERLNLNFLNHQKGIYFLFNADPKKALQYLKKNKNYNPEVLFSAKVFSNNTIECFNCEEEIVMKDEVFKASVFSFIKEEFTHIELTENLIKLEELTTDEKQWKVKLANYLLANYYFNISNTGYYRGMLNGKSNCCSYDYFNYSWEDTYVSGAEKISDNEGYNLSAIRYYDESFFNLSDISMKFYEDVIENSTDKELNARCLYMMAKCELNTFYNNNEEGGFEAKFSEYSTTKLPFYENSFKILEEEYSDTKFYDMIISECSYFEYYVDM